MLTIRVLRAREQRPCGNARIMPASLRRLCGSANSTRGFDIAVSTAPLEPDTDLISNDTL